MSRPSDRANDPAAELSAGQRRLLTTSLLLIPVLFFLLLEGGLRLFGYGEDYDLFQPFEAAPKYHLQNREVARRYFAQVENIPNAQNDFFLTEKPEDALRVFVQGGSSAAGYPFYYGGSFSRMLETRLAVSLPGRPVEVVNTAMAAVNTYTLLDFVDEILAHEPDAVLLYAGHNEYYGALGVGSAESLGRAPWLVRLYLQLDGLRTVQLLRRALSGLVGALGPTNEERAAQSTLMERMVGEQTIPLGSDLYASGLRQFRSNLSRMLARYEKAGVPVFIGTLASNERTHPPFVEALEEETNEAAYRERLDEVRSALVARDTSRALTLLDELAAEDTVAARPHFLRARLLDAQGRREEARTAYLAAKDRDALRFRAPEAVNAILRQEAAAHGATVVETQQALADASPVGIIGSEMMTEHLHPTIGGYFEIADAFYEALLASPVVQDARPIDRKQARAALLVTPIDSIVGEYRLRRLLGSWPFQPPGVFTFELDTVATPTREEELAKAFYQNELVWYEAQDRLQTHYVQQGRTDDALRILQAMIQEFPMQPETYYRTGVVLMEAGRYEQAEAYLRATLDLRETAAPHAMLGAIELQRYQRGSDEAVLEEAISHLQRSLRLEPRAPRVQYNLAVAFYEGQRYQEAIAAAERLRQLQPNHPQAGALIAAARQRAQASPEGS